MPGATITVSPELAASTAAWIDCPACTWIVFAPAGAARIMSPMIGSHVAFLMACPSFCVVVEAVTIGRVRADRHGLSSAPRMRFEAPVTVPES